MNRRYEFMISGEASRFLFGSTRRIRMQAAAAFESIAKSPFIEGDFEEVAPSGRKIQVKIFDNLIVSFWVDHGESEVRIMGCDAVE